MPKIARTTKTLDATGQAPGRLASQVARILMGKDKASYVPNVDGGDMVEVVNASKMKVTGNKMENKAYYSHTAHPGGLRTTLMKTVWAKDPGDVLRRAVSRMLPKNRLRDDRMKRLSIKN